jgi:putative regulatory protein susR
VVFILFVIGLFVAWWYIRKQMMELKKAQVIIARRNKQLETKNNQLEEVNKIKDEYIGRSFYINSEYINKVEKLYRTIDRKLMTRRIEDLRSSLKESELIAERKSMFVDFDETFLKLFPHFIEKYNELFDDPDSKCLDPKQLTTEMRIFALIRLGITDSERIATFLNYSVHTINTYKTRVKNRSHIDNDKFEGYIMKI